MLAEMLWDGKQEGMEASADALARMTTVVCRAHLPFAGTVV
jgi:hypothetical protein